MPRVPTYDDFQVAPTAFNPTPVQAPFSPEMASVGGRQIQALGQARERMADASVRIMLEDQRDINEASTKGSDNVAAENINIELNDEKSGYLNKQGSLALKDKDAVKERIQKIIDDAGQTLTNDMQRRMYKEVAQRRLQMAMQQIDVHASAQAKQWNLTETTNRVNSSRKDAVANWALWNMGSVNEAGGVPSNPFNAAKSTMLAETDRLAALKGYAPDSETAKNMRLEQTTVLHGDVINTMLAADKFKDAKLYYEKNSQEVDPEKRDEFKKILNTAGVAEESIKLARAMSIMNDGRSLVQQREELDLMLENGDITAAMHKETMAQLTQLHTMKKAEKAEQISAESTQLELSLKGKTLQVQLATLETMVTRKQISPEVRDNTRVRLEHNYQLAKAQQAEGEKSIIGGATDWFVQHPGANILDFQKANPSAYNALKNNGHLSGIVAFARGNKVDNDPATWASVMTNMEELKDMSPTDIYNRYRLKLDDSHLDRLYAMNAALNGSKDDKHLGVLTTQEQVKNAAQRMGILPYKGKPSESQEKAFDEFTNQLDARVALYEQTELKGMRKAGSQDLKKVLQDLEMDQVYQRRTLLPNKQVPLIALPKSEMATAYVKVGEEEILLSSIPTTQRALIIPALRAARKPVTEQNIADFWVRGGKKK